MLYNVRLNVLNSRNKNNQLAYLRVFWSLLFLITVLLCPLSAFSEEKTYDLVIIGASTGGTSAAMQAQSSGLKTLVIAQGEWWGGMLTSAGVSAVDGNHKLQGGNYKLFRDALIDHYGSNEALATGWVSHTQFEPDVGAAILNNFLSGESAPSVSFNSQLVSVRKQNGLFLITYENSKGETVETRSLFLIDATPLGDVAALLGVAYDLGMESHQITGEKLAPEESNDIVQDLTYVAILEKRDDAKLLEKPTQYNPENFRCACNPDKILESGINDCEQMLNYGRLPNNKFMINWPNCGNDYYLNMIKKTPKERAEALEEAKQYTLAFVYFLQHELGFTNLQIAENMFPTKDNLPMEAYHREGRRIEGLTRLKDFHLQSPYEHKLYRSGIAVGDYPIDHHHKQNPDAPEIDHISIQIPAYSVPLGALIPKGGPENFIVAEKSVSVSNIVNGTTRLQPVIMGIGQAAGAVVSIAINEGKKLSEVSVRAVQQKLLDRGAYIQPFCDVPPDHEHFQVVQRIGATGILKGFGVPYLWANEMWFYPERMISEYEYVQGLEDFLGESIHLPASGKQMTYDFLLKSLLAIKDLSVVQELKELNIPQPQEDYYLNRLDVSILLDKYLNPFSREISPNGDWQNN